MTLSVLAAALIYQLFIPPCIGLADNGDYLRNMVPFGISKSHLPYGDSYWNYFVPHYEFDAASRGWSRFVTTESVLIAPALALNAVVSKPGGFDLRCLGAVHVVVLLVAMWLMLVGSRILPRPARIVFAAGLVVIFSDVGYVSYLNSFYSESATLLSLLLLVGFLLLLATQARPKPVLFFGLVLSSIALVAAKPQNALAGPVLAILFVRGASLLRWKRCKMFWLAGAMTLVMATVAMLWLSPRWLRRNSQYIAVFTELLRDSPSPGHDLVNLGLDPSLAKLAGTHPWTKNCPIDNPAFEALFFARFNYMKLGEFYLRHPQRWIALMDRAARSALAIRWAELGNFEKAAGLSPRAQSTAFNLWSSFHQKALPHHALSLFLFLFGLMALPWAFYPGADRSARLLLEFQSGSVLIATLEVLAIIFIQGDLEVTRVMFVVDVLLDLAILATLAEVATAAVNAWSSGRNRVVDS